MALEQPAQRGAAAPPVGEAGRLRGLLRCWPFSRGARYSAGVWTGPGPIGHGSDGSYTGSTC